jgi:2-oxoisovalerate dehydrogenase E1 component
VDAAFVDHVRKCTQGAVPADLSAPVRPGARLTGRDAIRLFEAQIASRMLDFSARELKANGDGFYTIASSGHECNAAVGGALSPEDISFLHYRSGAYFMARAAMQSGPAGAFDVLLGMVASAQEPIAGGRHKVFGSVELNIPPQTSTIASHLPKAMGCALAIDRRARLLGIEDNRITICSFGDASANHSTAVGAIHATCWAAHQNLPIPVLFVCEDNGLGISVRTPENWIQAAYGHRPSLAYFYADGTDLAAASDAATAAIGYVRRHRKPAFLHLSVVRMLGHAGSDVEQLYRSTTEIESGEAEDPLRKSASLLIDNGWLAPDQVLSLYESTRRRIRALAREAVRRPKLSTRHQVMASLTEHVPEALGAAVRTANPEARRSVFPNRMPEDEERPRHLAIQLNRALHDIMLAHPESILFGEDVARKGGVYHVTANLTKHMGVGRVFNTLLDEQSILGLAIGAGHAGLLPLPEIQYLAYLMNAIDQLRGEAGSMQFFSNGQFSNPMVVRVASLAYQKGFGGHFHNDNGIAALREIPGVLIGCPARGDDAVRMLRTMVACASAFGRVSVFMEPIARYMTRDLHEDGDNLWQTAYPKPGDHMPVGEIGVYGDGQDLCIATYANGLWMSLRVAKRLELQGINARVIDLRWLAPLPHAELLEHAKATGRVLVVDECRASSGIADAVVAGLSEAAPTVLCRRVVGADTYIPLGDAANLVLVQESDIEEGALTLMAAS